MRCAPIDAIVDNGAAPTSHAALPHELGPQQGAELVDGHGLLSSDAVKAHERPEVRVGGRVVDQDVDRPEALDRSINAVTRLIGVTCVGDKCGDTVATASS
jgi:hypothetical protein